MRLIVSVFAVMALVVVTSGCIGTLTDANISPGMASHQQDPGFGAWTQDWGSAGYGPFNETYNCHFTSSFDSSNRQGAEDDWNNVMTDEPSTEYPVTMHSFNTIGYPVPEWAFAYQYGYKYYWMPYFRVYTTVDPGYVWNGGHYLNMMYSEGHDYKNRTKFESEKANNYADSMREPYFYSSWWYQYFRVWLYGPNNYGQITHGTGPFADARYWVNTCIDMMPGNQFQGSGQCAIDDPYETGDAWTAQTGIPWGVHVGIGSSYMTQVVDSHDLSLQDASGREIRDMDELFGKLLAARMNGFGDQFTVGLRGISIPGGASIELDSPLPIEMDSGMRKFQIRPDAVDAMAEFIEQLKTSDAQPGDVIDTDGVTLDFGSFSATMPEGMALQITYRADVLEDMVDQIRQNNNLQSERSRVRSPR